MQESLVECDVKQKVEREGEQRDRLCDCSVVFEMWTHEILTGRKDQLVDGGIGEGDRDIAHQEQHYHLDNFRMLSKSNDIID